MLWIRLDPDITILRSTVIEQPDYQWQYQLRHERDVTAQLDAIAALERYPTPASRLALTDTIENEQTYLQVRCKAAHCLTKVSTVILYCILRATTVHLECVLSLQVWPQYRSLLPKHNMQSGLLALDCANSVT